MIETKQYYDYVKDRLYEAGYNYKSVVPINDRRYEIVKGEYKGNKNINFLLIYKTEWFLKYGELFKKKNGIGESINLEDVKIALSREVSHILRITPQKHIYVIPLKRFIMHADKWTCKEGKQIMSISAHEFRNINDFKDLKDLLEWE